MCKRKASSEPPSPNSIAKRLRRDTKLSHEDPTILSNKLDPNSESESDNVKEIYPEEITVAIFCALPYEAVAVKYSLDEEYTCRPRSIGLQKYVYSYGRIKHHKVVIARPHYMGTVQAAYCAGAVRQQFGNVQYALMVGIGAGIPDLPKRDIRLGDIAVGVPRDNHPGVVQYDAAHASDDGIYIRGPLDKPPPLLISADGSLEEDEEMGRSRHKRFLKRIIAKNPRYGHPVAKDTLFSSEFHHVNKNADCTECETLCNPDQMICRDPRQPTAHRGLILSGNGVVKNPYDRQRLRQDYRYAICFEMEAAGIMDEIPCLVIRGICDYADTHKQDGWHRYASAVAAAYCKAVLYKVPEHIPKDAKAVKILTERVEQLSKQIKYLHERVRCIEKSRNKEFLKPVENDRKDLGIEKFKNKTVEEKTGCSLEESQAPRQYIFYGPVVLAEHTSAQEQRNG